MSMAFAPCREVGGKRFSFLSHYLAGQCEEYRVLARSEKTRIADAEAFDRNVDRVPAIPRYPADGTGWLKRKLLRVWARWICVADPYCGWVVPATVRGLKLCRRHRINLIIVTVPFFSPLIAATLISRLTGARLIVDYRDPWTNHLKSFPGIFGASVCRFIERSAIRQSSAVVFCSDVMKDQFLQAFAAEGPDRLDVIYNGFEKQQISPPPQRCDSSRVDMVYAGNFYGKRQLSVIAPVLAELLRGNAISAATFRLHLYSDLRDEDSGVISDFGLEDIVEVHDLVPYHQIQEIMSRSDLLFLLSGDDVSYAVPFKFFDYLRAGRPMLAVAPRGSTVEKIIAEVDCGEYADYSDESDIRRALHRLLNRREPYSFDGAERFYWSNAANSYFQLIQEVAGKNTQASSPNVEPDSP